MNRVFAWIGFLAVVDVVWLHAATYGAERLDAFGALERTLWGLAVPWFFLQGIFWIVVRWRGFADAMAKRVRRLLVPYFIWCLLGSLWSIALHGVRFQGLEALRYFGLHPYLDPVYQPMWFLRDLFLTLLAVAILLHLADRIAGRDPSARQLAPSSPGLIKQLVFPIYLIHSLWLSVARLLLGKLRFEGVELLLVVFVSVALSIGAYLLLSRFIPRVSALLFGKSWSWRG